MLSAYAAVGIRKPDLPYYSREAPNPMGIVECVCNYTKVPFKDVKGIKRHRMKVYTRQLCFYFLRSKTSLSLKDIGRLLGDRNHTTVLYGIQNIKDLHDTDEKVRQDIANLNLML